MDIEFDSEKDAINRDKHGVSLGFGVRVVEASGSLVIPSLRDVDGEPRFKTVGLVDGRLWTAVWVRRGRKIRFISVRKSNDGERRLYDCA